MWSVSSDARATVGQAGAATPVLSYGCAGLQHTSADPRLVHPPGRRTPDDRRGDTMNMPTPPDGDLPRHFGVYPAIVTDPVDPQSLGRVEVHFPWLGGADDRDLRAWATLCSPYGDDHQRPMVLPEVSSQVVVAFEAGDLRRPYILGAAWDGTAAQPESPSDDDNLRVLKT